MQNTVDGPMAPVDPDAVDPELLDLPAPPRGRRTVTLALMALVVVAAMAMVAGVRHDLAYYFASTEVIQLGDVNELDPAVLAPNTLVNVRGTPMTSRAVRYRRVLTGASHVVFPLAGQRTVYVHTEDSPSAIAQTEFTGRLVTFAQMRGRFGRVEQEMANTLRLPASGESFLLVADDDPGGYAWALMLALFCLLVVMVDVMLVVRWFRPIGDLPRPAREPAD